MPRTLEIEHPNIVNPEGIRPADSKIRVDLEPSVEVLGKLTELAMTKKANMDHHQYTLRG